MLYLEKLIPAINNELCTFTEIKEINPIKVFGLCWQVQKEEIQICYRNNNRFEPVLQHMQNSILYHRLSGGTIFSQREGWGRYNDYKISQQVDVVFLTNFEISKVYSETLLESLASNLPNGSEDSFEEIYGLRKMNIVLLSGVNNTNEILRREFGQTKEKTTHLAAASVRYSIEATVNPKCFSGSLVRCS